MRAARCAAWYEGFWYTAQAAAEHLRRRRHLGHVVTHDLQHCSAQTTNKQRNHHAPAVAQAPWALAPRRAEEVHASPNPVQRMMLTAVLHLPMKSMSAMPYVLLSLHHPLFLYSISTLALAEL
jgi:hypothetical protein